MLPLVFTGCFLRPHDADQYTVEGFDVSRYQATIDWERVSEARQDFVFIKATEGRTLRDPQFLTNWFGAERSGVRRGAYHFFRPGVDPGEQARLYFSTVELQPGDFPPVLDIEKTGGLSSRELVKRAKQWLTLVELRYGVKPILYTGQNFYNRHLAGQFDDYPLWLARYDHEQPVTVCGRTFQFWQYSDRGRVRGVKGRVDRNVFTGTAEEWEGLSIPAQDQPSDAPRDLDLVPISAEPNPNAAEDLADFQF